MSETIDFTDPGALPGLTSPGSQVLGTPASKAKSKTNVGKFAILGIVLAAFLFIVAGLLMYQRHKRNQASAEPAIGAKLAQAIKPGFAQKNAAVESDSIEKAKAEIKKKDGEEKAQLKAIQEAQVEAQRQAEAEAGKKGAGAAGGMTSQRAAQGGQRAASAPLTPTERAMAGGVLLDATGAKPRADKPEAEKDQQQREVQARMGAMGVQSSGGSGGVAAASGGQSNDSIAARLQPTVLQARSAGRLPNLDYLLKRGTFIPCALKTGIDTTVPGFVICEVLNDVRSANGNTVLIDRGATVFGEQQSGLKQGQQRTFVVWTRIDNPNGVFVNIDSPATDQMGYSGVPGYVDTHFSQRFGGAIMLSMIQDFSTALSQHWANQQSAKSNNNSGATVVNSQPPLQNSQQAAQDMASEALRNSINIPPTLVVNPATIVNVMVARDVSFENVFSLVK